MVTFERFSTARTEVVENSKEARFAKFAWFVLAYNMLVIMWGALVRATSSGAGCGSHWPLCDGQIIPLNGSIKTLIEFSHRLSSGLDGLIILGLLIAAFRTFPAKHRVRTATTLAFLFTLLEGIIGRALVKKRMGCG